MTLVDDDFFCHDLPSRPQPEVGKILVTGGTGYIGGRLVPELMARGYRVRVMVRAISDEQKQRWPSAEIVAADALDPDRLRTALEGIHAAYYLIHSLLLGREEFESKEIQAAENFRRIAEEKGVARIIYLGGLGEVRTPLSPHLRSRMKVAEELSRGAVPTTVLRAATIIGSGSASYEIIEHLVKSLPIIPIPYWAKTKCQPIGIRDVIKYLVGVLETHETLGRSFDVGGKRRFELQGNVGDTCRPVGQEEALHSLSFLQHRVFRVFHRSFYTSARPDRPVPDGRNHQRGRLSER
jgi:uncharacterized protein YbjT (DUF2867 family)